jgi:hypothetical protein
MIENAIWIIEDGSYGIQGAAKTELGAWKAYIESGGVSPDEEVYLYETKEYKTIRECLGRFPNEEVSIDELAKWCMEQNHNGSYMWDDWVYIYRVEYHNE